MLDALHEWALVALQKTGFAGATLFPSMKIFLSNRFNRCSFKKLWVSSTAR